MIAILVARLRETMVVVRTAWRILQLTSIIHLTVAMLPVAKIQSPVIRSTMKTSSWGKSWIPVAVLEDIDSKLVHSSKVLGKDLIFYQASSNWVVAEDRCPHRAAPLSEGYLNQTSGDLICRYHGWQFGSNGNCNHIPQSDVDSSKQFSKACMKTYPAKVDSGLLWMWPNDDHSLAAATAIPGEDDSDSIPINIMQENMIDYPMMVENTFDPSHASFTHDGVGGLSAATAFPMQHFQHIGNITRDGFVLQHSGYDSKSANVTTKREFIAPYTNLVKYENSPVKSVMLLFVPIKPGYTRVFGAIKASLNNTNVVIKTVYKLVNLLPKWLFRGFVHRSGYTIVEQDLMIQHRQQLHMQRDSQQGIRWQQSYYLPSKADVGMVTFRRWFDDFSHGKISWLEPSVENDWIQEMNDEQLLNRWTRHTKHCNSCQKTAKLLRTRIQPTLSILTLLVAVALIRDVLQGLQLGGGVLKIKSFVSKLLMLALTFVLKSKVNEMYEGYFIGKMPFRKNAIPDTVNL